MEESCTQRKRHVEMQAMSRAALQCMMSHRPLQAGKHSES